MYRPHYAISADSARGSRVAGDAMNLYLDEIYERIVIRSSFGLTSLLYGPISTSDHADQLTDYLRKDGYGVSIEYLRTESNTRQQEKAFKYLYITRYEPSKVLGGIQESNGQDVGNNDQKE